MRRIALAAIACCLVFPRSLPAQTLRDRVIDLFRFGGGCPDPVCLSVGSAHGEHFNPAARAGGAQLFGFLQDAIGASTGDIPLSAASSGAIWGTSASGLPVRTATSSGPIFAERGETMGRGRALFALNVSRYAFRSIRGVPLNDLEFTFTHQQNGAGDFEQDVIEVRSDLSVSLTAVTAVATYGLFRWLDVGVAVPFVRTALSGTSTAQVMPFTNPTPHYFGTAADPQLRSTATAAGSASGIGDVAGRVKAMILQHGPTAIALLGDVRFATGDDSNFLGAGHSSVRALAIASTRFGTFAPHLNAGYWVRGGDVNSDAVLLTAGFDQLVSPRVTFAGDLISEWQVGTSGLAQPAPVTLRTPIGSDTAIRIIQPSNIPDRKDSQVLASFGFKFGVTPALMVVTNGIIPIRQGGLQPGVAWTTGLEYAF